MTELTKVRITVEGAKVALVFERPCDALLTHWKDALRVLRCLDECVRYVAQLPEGAAEFEKRVEVGVARDGVLLRFPWSDRILMALPEAADLTVRMKEAVRDAQLADNAKAGGVGRIMRAMCVGRN